jgi:starch synthase
VIEDFLEPQGLSLDAFCSEFRGSWMFGYVDALRAADVRTAIVLVSRSVRRVERRAHAPTGADVIVVPAPRPYRAIARCMRNPYGRTAVQTFGDLHGFRRSLRPLAAVVREAAPWLSTPSRTIRREVVCLGCAAMLCQEYEFPRFDACARISRASGIPLFATFQGGDYRRWRAERLVRGRSMRACTGFIISSVVEVERVRSVYGVGDTEIQSIPNPVDVSVWRPGDRAAARERLGFPPGTSVVAWHGRVQVEKKGLDVLLDAWKNVSNQRDAGTVRLVLIGDGPDRELLRDSIAANGLAGVTFYDSHVHDREILRSYLVAADVYVFPSRYEGFAVAPIEAMACGLPVVAADCFGIREVLPEGETSGGIVVPREDPHALSAALGRLIDNPELATTLGNRARDRAVEAFSHAVVGRRLREFLLAERTA